MKRYLERLNNPKNDNNQIVLFRLYYLSKNLHVLEFFIITQ